ncbi:MAG: quinone-dependent dihydroorotate dehydrogenase [Alphaproteobacteria bacterium]|nr:quinone-dependent dihydroorotate dehydrogenase [Alphaproteobacteria bacterium]
MTKKTSLFNPWTQIAKMGDPYPLIRPLLFKLDPEDAHMLTVQMLKYGLGPGFYGPDDPILRSTLFGMDFPNPVGLAAGLDKQATCPDAFMGFGFGSIEVGTVTPKPQAGNSRPRMFRVSETKGLINRFGFNSIGVSAFAENMRKWRDKKNRSFNPVGINIGRNKETADEQEDYLICFERLAPYADFITINISSPNTPGLRDLQTLERSTALIEKLDELRKILAPQMPFLLKIAPDLTQQQQEDIAQLAKAGKIQGLIISNTTIQRPDTVPADLAAQEGGLSGSALFQLSTQVLSNMYRLTEGKVPLIGCGGIDSAETAYAKIRAGASMVQIYTTLVYEGPMIVETIKRGLVELLRRDDFANISQAVGADHARQTPAQTFEASLAQ